MEIMQTHCPPVSSAKKSSSREFRPQSECCTGCTHPITDRYYLVLMNRAWHTACLRCCECSLNLETHVSCFIKDGQIYCKDDYFK